MLRPRLIALAAVLALGAPLAQAAPVLIAKGSISGSLFDLASSTHGALENGAAGNMLGGLGSGLAWAGGNTFLAVPDRGPNATAYNAGVDDTMSYITRFQTMTLSLTPSASGSPLRFDLTPALAATTLLSSSTPLNYGTGAGLGLPSGAPALNAVDGK